MQENRQTLCSRERGDGSRRLRVKGVRRDLGREDEVEGGRGSHIRPMKEIRIDKNRQKEGKESARFSWLTSSCIIITNIVI